MVVESTLEGGELVLQSGNRLIRITLIQVIQSFLIVKFKIIVLKLVLDWGLGRNFSSQNTLDVKALLSHLLFHTAALILLQLRSR